MCKRRIKRRGWSSDAATSGNGCLSGAKDTHIDRRKVLGVQANASHVKPLVARLTLDHGLAVIQGSIADATSAVT